MAPMLRDDWLADDFDSREFNLHSLPKPLTEGQVGRLIAP
jgi:hypothetical protein